MTKKRQSSEEENLDKVQLKAAAGGSGRGGSGRGSGSGSGGRGFRAGDNLLCEVLRAALGGYEVKILDANLEGFLPTQARLKKGQEIVGQFVCIYNNRILVSARFKKT